MRDIRWLRRLLALHQIVYLLQFWPEPWRWFSPGERVWPAMTYPNFPSIFRYVSGADATTALWGAAIGLWLCFGLVRLPRLVQLLLLALQVSLHHANPLVIHEPQQIANFLLVVSILWPSRSHHPELPLLRRLMVLILGSYYFIAGLKKLPDAQWVHGDALAWILQWPPLAKDTVVTRSLLGAPWLARVATWGTLVFELGFLPLALLGFRWMLVLAGFAFHLMIYATLEVGTFSLVMLPFYGFLMFNRPRKPS